ncbi:S16 family serine protease [Arthrobacter sp. Helios]|uniref:YlbL family protein n=1 Tax=Arthrobacter sp. Helios TaxID=2828862 RepID=UPI0020598DFC|nr:S16 family serine protease [Arthrobacter sp. Helios]UPO75635.1 PDZ domain-containing protein [Arthrobacter sp. Helios]
MRSPNEDFPPAADGAEIPSADSTADAGPGPSRGRRSPRRRALFVAGGTALLLGAAGLMLPAPYVVESPGPTFNTIGEIPSGPLISIEGRETYPTAGELDLTTVYVSGGPNGAVSMAEVLAAWISPDDAVLPVDFVYPPGTTSGQVKEENAAAMTSSQESAVAAALAQLDIPFTEELAVAGTMEGAPADGKLETGDVLLQVDGKSVEGMDSLRQALNESEGNPADITVRRNGGEQTVSITPELSDSGAYQMGAYLSIDFTFPFEVSIALENVGGASAGTMFALGIIDKLTPGELTNGRHFAGTGTIDASGNVGPIGGIEQKMVGAKSSGAEFFLAPEANCEEVAGNIPADLVVVSVATLDDALTAVETLAAGGSAAGLGSCTDGA